MKFWPHIIWPMLLEKQGDGRSGRSRPRPDGEECPELHISTILAIGRVQERKKRLSLAEEEYRQAIRLAPQEMEAHFRLAVVLRALAKTAKANEEFQTFSQLQTHRNVGPARGWGECAHISPISISAMPAGDCNWILLSAETSPEGQHLLLASTLISLLRSSSAIERLHTR